MKKTVVNKKNLTFVDIKSINTDGTFVPASLELM